MGITNKTISDFVEGKQSAIEKIYLEYKNLMYFIIASYLDNEEDCNDVLSESFLRAIEHAHDIKDISKLKAFLCSIAKNEAINYRNKHNRIVNTDIIDELYGEEDRTNALLNNIEPLLTNKETIVIYYRIGFSYSWKEIADETGIPESTARRLFVQAKDKLRKELL